MSSPARVAPVQTAPRSGARHGRQHFPGHAHGFRIRPRTHGARTAPHTAATADLRERAPRSARARTGHRRTVRVPRRPLGLRYGTGPRARSVQARQHSPHHGSDRLHRSAGSPVPRGPITGSGRPSDELDDRAVPHPLSEEYLLGPMTTDPRQPTTPLWAEVHGTGHKEGRARGPARHPVAPTRTRAIREDRGRPRPRPHGPDRNPRTDGPGTPGTTPRPRP